MLFRFMDGALALALALVLATAGAQAHDENKYPDLRGQWRRLGSGEWTPAGQKPPLTAEYQAIYDENLKDQASGGHGIEPSYMCLPPGMPRAMLAYTQMEVVITDATTYILIDHIHDDRRIFTDGRDWPNEVEPSFRGYSIGKWLDEDGDGRYDTLEVETRYFKEARAPTIPPACRCTTTTTRPWSRNASVSTRSTRTSSTMRSPPSTMP